jgi:hypothetical protein
MNSKHDITCAKITAQLKPETVATEKNQQLQQNAL